MKTIIIVSIYGISKKAPDWTKTNPKMEYFMTAAPSSADTPFYLGDIGYQYRLDSESTDKRKMVSIRLPKDVHEGVWKEGYNRRFGLYGEYDAKDGNGRKVVIRTKENPVWSIKEDAGLLIDTAIKSGIILSIPRKNGREDVLAPVLDVSPMDCDVTIKEWLEWCERA